MKILGIVGSNRKEGNSYLLLREAFHGLPDAETRIIQFADLNIRPCELCFELCAHKPFECVIKDDLAVLLEEIESADGLIIACPFYFYVPSKFQPFLERVSCLDYFTGGKHGKEVSPFASKPCALICVSASGSSFNAFQMLHHLQEFALMLRMRVIGVNRWPFIGLSVKSGEMAQGAILEEEEEIGRARELVQSLIREIKLG